MVQFACNVNVSVDDAIDEILRSAPSNVKDIGDMIIFWPESGEIIPIPS